MDSWQISFQDAVAAVGFDAHIAYAVCLRLGALYHDKGAVKMHTLLDYDCLLPEFVNITDGKGSDNKAAYDIPVNPYSIVVADRGYCDYSLLSHWDSNNVFFVVRHKDNIRYKTVRERLLPEKRAQDVLIDEEIELELPVAKRNIQRNSAELPYGTKNMVSWWNF